MIFLLFISFIGWVLWSLYSLLSYRRVSVAGKTVVITGGSVGIGKHLALHFLRLGATVHVWDDNKEKLSQLSKEALLIPSPRPTKSANCDTEGLTETSANELEGNDCLKTVVVDLSNRFHLHRLVKQVGTVHIVVNAALNVSSKAFLDHADNAIERILHVNALCPLILARAFLPAMLERREGYFVTITDANGLLGNASQPDFAASQWAAVGAHESIQMLIRENGCCGKVRTTLLCPYNVVSSQPTLLRTPSPFSSSRVMNTADAANTAEGQSVNTIRRSRILGYFLSIFRRPVTPEEAAEACVWAITHGVERLYIPYSLLFLTLFRFLPVPWFMWVISPSTQSTNVETSKGNCPSESDSSRSSSEK
ncbi:short-chain dehydrogenase, putative [Trypanosoma brucei gambiense DAL972]|uniref:Short-chain dehydrogenase, putative n=1 Tax=Trypanosoma brucei gambiense (strain MHOM/CI/86/DAL972) TaxID=679716 RepID=D0A3A6_TRYB9|nr:short-chain dehydrogenase, putative [Trypanosoma brucei gambiense DAL972]CBH15750.1 short-chain dehydrogenase, putative [Trypanosoma brucei gambiense DAL972]|eukprot:XP_011778014.1 short-chain dehydrogenase, putative [Trypanosoma brucei gambiense DAL972]